MHGCSPRRTWAARLETGAARPMPRRLTPTPPTEPRSSVRSKPPWCSSGAARRHRLHPDGFPRQAYEPVSSGAPPNPLVAVGVAVERLAYAVGIRLALVG